jgi:hypothetical protein
MPLKLIRKTTNGELQLDGYPVYIAGTVDAAAHLPHSGEAVGESYWVGSEPSKVLYIWNGNFWDGNNGNEGSGSDAAALDAASINQTLIQTGFPAIA